MITQPRKARLFLALTLLFALILPMAPAALAQDVAVIHYHRPDGDYEGWGLHAWDAAAVTVEWANPLPPDGEDDFGIFWEVPIKPDGTRLGFIVHKGDLKDPGPDQFLDLTKSKQAWVISGDLLVYTERPDPSAHPQGDLNRSRAHW